MKNMQKAGGIGAFVLASAYIIGIGLVFTLLDTSGISDPIEKVGFIVDNYAAFYIWICMIYILAGIFLIPLTLGIKERLEACSQEKDPLFLLGAVFGLIWAVLILGSGLVHNTGLLETVKIYQENPQKAWEFWYLIETVHRGIGAEAEIPGGIWSLLVGLAALKTTAFPKWLNILAIIAGISGLLTIIPMLADYIIALYALAHVIWWSGIGIVMLRKSNL